MSFHIVKRQRIPGRRAHAMRVTARIVSSRGNSRTMVTISGDLIAHLRARPGDFVRPLIGFGEDQGDFAIERVNSRRDGYTLLAQPYGRSANFSVKTSEFLPLTPGFTTVFDIELAEGRVICRAPQSAALAHAAE